MQPDAERYFDLRSAYQQKFGAIHEAILEVPLELQIALLELALAGELEIGEKPINRALLEADQLIECCRNFKAQG